MIQAGSGLMSHRPVRADKPPSKAGHRAGRPRAHHPAAFRGGRAFFSPLLAAAQSSGQGIRRRILRWGPICLARAWWLDEPAWLLMSARYSAPRQGKPNQMAAFCRAFHTNRRGTAPLPNPALATHECWPGRLPAGVMNRMDLRRTRSLMSNRLARSTNNCQKMTPIRCRNGRLAKYLRKPIDALKYERKIAGWGGGRARSRKRSPIIGCGGSHPRSGARHVAAAAAILPRT